MAHTKWSRAGILAAAVLTLLIAGCATRPEASDRRLVMAPGTRATIRINPDNTITIVGVKAGEVQRAGAPPSDSSTSKARRGEVVISMTYDRGEGTLLKIENGAGFNFDYGAVMVVPDHGASRREATSVCTVLKGAAAYEHWPHPVALIVLSNFAPYNGQPHCPEPEALPKDDDKDV